MINVTNLSLSFGEQILFDNISFNIQSDQKIGLVGRNGSGKTTLLKVIANQQNIDSGKINIPKDFKIAYMPQEVVLLSGKSVSKEALTAFGDLAYIADEIEKLEKIIEQGDATAQQVDKYSQLHHKLIEFGYEEKLVDIKKVLQGLGFSQEQFNHPVSNLSVGWKMRVVLAKLLLKNADFYLFDEPTNHLDIVAKDWFLDFLRNSNFGFILVSHDKYFLDHLSEQIYELSLGKLNVYKDNYSKYLVQKEKDQALLEKKKLEQEKEIKKKKEVIERFRAKATKAKMAQSMLKSLEKINLIEIEHKPKSVRFHFGDVKRSGKIVLNAKNLSISFGDKKVFNNVSFEVERGQKVAIVAPNGVGKTTLLNLIMGKYEIGRSAVQQDSSTELRVNGTFNDLGEQNSKVFENSLSVCPEEPAEASRRLASRRVSCGGLVELGHNIFPTYFEQDQNRSLDLNKSILDEVEGSCTTSEQRTRVRGYLGAFLFSGDDVNKRIKVLSGGEKNRIAMVKTLLQDANFLILDEPTNHLDLDSKEILLNVLKQYQGTILFVSHDRNFLNELATNIIELTPNGTFSYSGNYDSYLYQKQGQGVSLNKEKKTSKTEKYVKSEDQKGKRKNDYLLRKRIGSLEKKIERLEKELVKESQKFENLEYGTDEYSKTYSKIQELEQKIKQSMQEWEKIHG